MTPEEWLREVRRYAVPSMLLIEAEKIIAAQGKMIASMGERIDVMREILAKRAEKQ